MAHNTKPILVDVNGKPIPQYFDPLADEYKPLLGQHGAARSTLYGPDGQPITNENPLEVRARLLEELLGALNATKETNPDASTATLLALLRGLLASVGKEATLAAIKDSDGIKKIADAVTVSGLENLATETTLAQVKQVLDTLNGAVSTSAGQADIQQAIAALAGIVAKESTLGQAKGVLDAISGKVATDQGVGSVASAVEALAQIAATENTLSQAVQKLESIVSSLQQTLTVDGEVQLNGSLPAFAETPTVDIGADPGTLRPMLGATKTASRVASEVFAGTSRKANRRGLAIKNEHPYLRIRLDGSSVTDTTGIALEPFWIAIFEFDPAVDVPVYVISEAGLVRYGVVEW